MRRFSQKSALVTLSEINITPLLDLAFVLLIIFIITTPLLEQELDRLREHERRGAALGKRRVVELHKHPFFLDPEYFDLPDALEAVQQISRVPGTSRPLI